MTQAGYIGAVVIGRNEGQRLVRCMAALQECHRVDQVVYVDSGSTDASIDVARAAGATVVELDLDQPFTAARARNTGFATLVQIATPDFVQFIDGDCELDPQWVVTAYAFMRAHPRTAVTCGRRREKFPEASVYNRLIDREWDTPIGKARACGGDALMRVEAFASVGGFNLQMIAGEEPELCVRLRLSGWEIDRLDAEMTLHDAAITRFGQWWKRAWRAGHAYAEGAALHGGPPDFHNRVERRRALLWGVGVPLVAIFGLFLTPWSAAILLLWPLQVVRLSLRGEGWAGAGFLTLCKFPEAGGVLEYAVRKAAGKQATIMEYKSQDPA